MTLKDYDLTTRSAFAAALLISMSLASQAQTNSGDVIPAEGVKPDKVATSLMPVPIYNFAIHNLAFRPDGKILATGDGNGTVRFWETKTGELQTSVAAHTNWAFSIAWSRDGKYFATGGGDDLVHWFDVANPEKPLKTFTGHSGDVHAVVITPNGRSIVSAGDDKRIIVWDVKSAKPEREWVAHQLQIPTLALSPNGKILASGSRDNLIHLWNSSSGKLRETLIGHTGDVMSLRFSPDGKTLASASYDRTVRLWNVDSGKALRIFSGHNGRVFNVAFSPDGKRLASAGDGTVRIWDVNNGEMIRVISLNGTISSDKGTVRENLSSVAFSPDGNSLAVGSTTGLAFLLSPTGEVLWKLKAPKLN